VRYFRPSLLDDLKPKITELYDRLGMDEGGQRDFLA